jgi:hypothetical protein
MVSDAPTTWATTNPAMNAVRKEATQGEADVSPPDILPVGLDMRPDYSVKPMRSFEDPLMVISFYPTSDPTSSVHLSYSTANYMSNESMSSLLVELGFDVANVRTTGMFLVDVFPRRLDRKTMIGMMPLTLSLTFYDYISRHSFIYV